MPEIDEDLINAEIEFNKLPKKEQRKLISRLYPQKDSAIHEPTITITVAEYEALTMACKAIIEWCDKNPPAGDALWCVQLCRDAVAMQETKP
jgi:hypothetical protein